MQAFVLVLASLLCCQAFAAQPKEPKPGDPDSWLGERAQWRYDWCMKHPTSPAVKLEQSKRVKYCTKHTAQITGFHLTGSQKCRAQDCKLDTVGYLCFGGNSHFSGLDYFDDSVIAVKYDPELSHCNYDTGQCYHVEKEVIHCKAKGAVDCRPVEGCIFHGGKTVTGKPAVKIGNRYYPLNKTQWEIVREKAAKQMENSAAVKSALAIITQAEAEVMRSGTGFSREWYEIHHIPTELSFLIMELRNTGNKKRISKWAQIARRAVAEAPQCIRKASDISGIESCQQDLNYDLKRAYEECNLQQYYHDLQSLGASQIAVIEATKTLAVTALSFGAGAQVANVMNEALGSVLGPAVVMTIANGVGLGTDLFAKHSMHRLLYGHFHKDLGKDVAWFSIDRAVDLFGGLAAAGLGHAITWLAPKFHKAVSASQKLAKVRGIARLAEWTVGSGAKFLKSLSEVVGAVTVNCVYILVKQNVAIAQETDPKKRKLMEDDRDTQIYASLVSGALTVFVPQPAALDSKLRDFMLSVYMGAVPLKDVTAAFYKYETAVANARVGTFGTLPMFSLFPLANLTNVVDTNVDEGTAPVKLPPGSNPNLEYKEPKLDRNKKPFVVKPFKYDRGMNGTELAPGENMNCVVQEDCSKYGLVCSRLTRLCERCTTDIECETKYPPSEQPLIANFTIRCHPTFHYCALNRASTWRYTQPNLFYYAGDFIRLNDSMGPELMPEENFQCLRDADCGELRCSTMLNLCERCSTEAECLHKYKNMPVKDGWKWTCHPTMQTCVKKRKGLKGLEWQIHNSFDGWPVWRRYPMSMGGGLKPKENFVCERDEQCGTDLRCNPLVGVCELCEEDAQCQKKYPGVFGTNNNTFGCHPNKTVCLLREKEGWLEVKGERPKVLGSYHYERSEVLHRNKMYELQKQKSFLTKEQLFGKGHHGRWKGIKPHGALPQDQQCVLKEHGMCGHKDDCRTKVVPLLCGGEGDRMCCSGRVKPKETSTTTKSNKLVDNKPKSTEKGPSKRAQLLGEELNRKKAGMHAHGAYPFDKRCSSRTSGMCGHRDDCKTSVVAGLCGGVGARMCCIEHLPKK